MPFYFSPQDGPSHTRRDRRSSLLGGDLPVLLLLLPVLLSLLLLPFEARADGDFRRTFRTASLMRLPLPPSEK